ncbi:metallophosphoesterase [Roseicyclus sp.]
MTIYAIGDIHGHLDLLRAAHDRVETDRAREAGTDAPLVHVGDLVDRGPDSAGVVAFVMARHAEDARIETLTSNHDRMFTRFLEPVPRPDPRLRAGLGYLSPQVGGLDTLASYGVARDAPDPQLAARARVPEAHLAFLRDRPASLATPQVFLAHAGVRPGVPLEAQDIDDLVWIREPFLSDTRDHGALVVHGHTPVERVELHPNRLAIDTGAAYGGPVSAVAIEADGRVFVLTDAGRVPVRPMSP